MAELFTKIILRNDSHNNWEAVKDTVVLLKGELGIEFNPDAESTSKKVLIKIGDGVSTWSALPYFCEDKADIADTLAGYGITDAYTKDEVNALIQSAKGYVDELIAAIPAQVDYSVSIEEDTTDSSIAKRYIFKQLGAEIGRIDLAKELVVTSGSVKEVAEENVPYSNAKVGDKYIELVIANQEEPIYVPAKDLVDIYTAAADASEVQLAISATNEISAVLVDGGITEAKLATEVAEKLNKVYEEVGVAETLVQALADGAVNANTQAIAAINDESTGVLATAKTYAKGLTDDVALRVAELEKVDHEHANKELLDTYTQTEADLALAVANTHKHDNAEVIGVITADKVDAWDAAERNVIAAVDVGQFVVDADRKLSLTAVDQSLVTGLTNSAGNSATIAELFDTKVSKNGTDRLITEAEAAKLELLVIDEETGQAAISGTVNASQVQGLADLLNAKVDKVDGMGLSANNFTNELLDKLNGIESAAQVNVIESITFNGTAVSVDDDKVAAIVYELPVATTSTLGGVKSSDAENNVSVAEDGTMSVNSLNVNKLVQTAGDVFVMNGGSAAM